MAFPFSEARWPSFDEHVLIGAQIEAARKQANPEAEKPLAPEVSQTRVIAAAGLADALKTVLSK